MSFERRLDDESRAADSTEKKVHRLKHKKRNLFFEKRPFILSDGVGKDAISFSFLKEDSKGALSLASQDFLSSRNGFGDILNPITEPVGCLA